MTWPGGFVERFWSRVDRREPDECWEWQGCRIRQGYGQITYQRKQYSAHRIALTLSGVDVPKELDVLHSCDNPACCNPMHLRTGTAKENALDAVMRGRMVMPPVHRGEGHHLAKLTPSSVQEIRRLSDDGLSSYEIARRFPVTPRAIRKVLNGESWRHVL